MRHLDTAEVDDLLVAAMHHDVHLHVVDGGYDRETVLDAFALAFDLPDYFGHNLDALMDCLRDVADRHMGEWVLLWRPLGIAAVSEPDGPVPAGVGHEEIDDGVVGVLEDLESEYPDLTVAIG